MVPLELVNNRPLVWLLPVLRGFGGSVGWSSVWWGSCWGGWFCCELARILTTTGDLARFECDCKKTVVRNRNLRASATTCHDVWLCAIVVEISNTSYILRFLLASTSTP